MNPDTFHGVGTHVVIALFTAGVPHPSSKRTTFVDFRDDGYKVRQHVGLFDDGRAADRRKQLLEVVKDGVPDDTAVVVGGDHVPWCGAASNRLARRTDVAGSIKLPGWTG